MTDRMFGFLPPEGRQRVLEIQQRYNIRSQRLSIDGSNEPDASGQLEREMFGEIATVLNPQEMEEFELRFSRTADSMREELGPFSPTEQEFKEIFRLRKQSSDALAAIDPADLQGRAELEQNLNKDITELLGLKRQWEYHRSTTSEYRASLPIILPLTLVVLLQVAALLAVYLGGISGKDETTIDLGSHVLALRIGWPIIFVLALICHVIERRGNSKSKEDL